MAKTTITSRIENEIKLDLQALAIKKKTTSSALNEMLLRAYIKQQKEQGAI